MSESDISNEDRRTMGNLAIPRTAAGLADRMASDPDVPRRSAEVVSEHLSDLVSRGLVVNLGGGEPMEVTKAVGSSSDAINFGKGQAKSWRELADAGRYDLGGDLYILSQAGLDLLRGGPHVPDEYVGVQDTIDELDAELGNGEEDE